MREAAASHAASAPPRGPTPHANPTGAAEAGGANKLHRVCVMVVLQRVWGRGVWVVIGASHSRLASRRQVWGTERCRAAGLERLLGAHSLGPAP